MAPFTVDTAAGNDPTQDLDGNATPRAKSITRLRTFTSVLSPVLQQPLRQEKAELDVQTTPAQTTDGGIAVSTRDTVAFGFGLEQVDQATREALVSQGVRLPAADHRRHDRAGGRRSPTRPSSTQVTAVDPVDLEVKGYDERGDIKEVRLYANDTLVKAKRSFPFQFRYYVPASAAANSIITFKAEAEDKAGNVKTITRQVRVVSAHGDRADADRGRPSRR